MFLARRGRHRRPSTVAISIATEPQYVFGAATDCLRLDVEMKSEHATGCRPCQAQPSGKKARNPLLGVVCLLTTGVLIRVRLGLPFRARSPLFLRSWGGLRRGTSGGRDPDAAMVFPGRAFQRLQGVLHHVSRRARWPCSHAPFVRADPSLTHSWA